MGIVVKSDKMIVLDNKIVVTPRSTNIEYGYLYNWRAVNNANGLAPYGWHIPTKTEVETLITYLTDNGYGYGGSGSDIAKSIASVLGWYASETNGCPGNDSGSNNSSGLNLAPSGYRVGGTFMHLTGASIIWTATEYNAAEANCENIYFDSPNTNDLGARMYKHIGLAVRYMRDNDTGWNGQKLVDIDGNVYETVKIGTQIWTCQNAATTRYRNGTAIPLITDNTAWSADTTGARCAYSNDNSYVYL